MASFTSVTPGGVSATELYPATSDGSKFLNVAFAIVYKTAPSTEMSVYLGSINAYAKKYAADGSITYTKLASHVCTDAELSSNFYPTSYKDN